MKNSTNVPTKKTKFIHAIVPLLFLIGSLTYTIKFTEASPHIPILMTGIVTTFIGIFILKYKWEYILEGILNSIKSSMEAAIILLIIGMIVGSWISSGVVPTMIYYGLKIISPAVFLPATLVLSLIVSLATGSSWGTAATVGIALMGVGTGLGIPSYITGGAIISGAYMGDKLSPLSDTTNLAPAMAGSTLFEHIKSMLYTTVPSFIISLFLFAFIGKKYSGENINIENLNSILNTLNSEFIITPILFIVPILTIILVIKKVPAIPALFLGSIIGGIGAVTIQKVPFGTFITILQKGYVSNSGNMVVDNLLTRGGLDSMTSTVTLIICALFFGGVMERTQMLHAVAEKILSFAKSTGSLILSTVLTAISVNILAGDQYLSIVLTGRIFKEAYGERNLHPVALSKVLEDSGTLTSPLIPWNSCGAYMIATLGLAPWVYVPYCFLNLINPIISVIYGYTGITIRYLKEKNQNKKIKLRHIATAIFK